MNRPKVAIVTPRFGAEVGGGAERLAREYATRLAGHFDVTVLTTCARDYRTWADDYPPGETLEDGVRVLRFRVPVPRDDNRFEALSQRTFGMSVVTGHDEQRWMDAQGPNAPDLLAHLDSEGSGYAAVIFVPYVYATTVRGLPLVADRAVLVPALHDEPTLRLGIFAPVVEAARAVIVSTPEESDLVASRFAVDPRRVHLVGAGVDPPGETDPDRFRRELGLDRPYVVAVGRIDASKGSEHLIGYHERLRARDADAPDLVLVGPAAMALPEHPWLHTPGFIDEDLKNSAIAGAIALVCPSPFESLSLVLLEAWANGIPTICSAASDVLVAQTRRASAGLWYRDGDEYAECVELLSRTRAVTRALGLNGRRFARTLAWPDVETRLVAAVSTVVESNGDRAIRSDATPPDESGGEPGAVGFATEQQRVQP